MSAHIQTPSPIVSKKTVFACLGGAIAITLLLFVLPWGWLGGALVGVLESVWSAIGPGVSAFFSAIGSALAFCFRALMYPLFWVSSFLLIWPSITWAVLICATLCYVCLGKKGAFEENQTWSKNPRLLQERIATGLVGFTMYFLGSLLFNVLMSSYEKSPQYRAVVSAVEFPKPADGMGFGHRLSEDLYAQGQAKRHVLPAPCRSLASYGVSGALTLTINGKPADPANCRLGRNTLVWSVNP